MFIAVTELFITYPTIVIKLGAIPFGVKVGLSHNYDQNFCTVVL